MRYKLPLFHKYFYETTNNKNYNPFAMNYNRMSIEVESPEEVGYDTIRYNLSESSVRDRTFGELNIDLNNLVLAYSEHRGILPLREVIAVENQVLNAYDVLVTTGAAMSLFLVSTTLLSPADHLIVIRPNYATNIETPRAIGCQMSIVDLDFDNGFDLDPERIRAVVKPNTKLISITNPHNPTGKLFSEETINAIVAIAEANDCYLVIDETYRDLNFQTPLRPYSAILSQKVISICSLSKAFGVPGIRIGWLICRDKNLMNSLLAAKEQIVLGNSVIDETIALHLLKQKTTLIPAVHAQIQDNFDIFIKWIENQCFVEYTAPQAGVVCFVRLKKEYELDFTTFRKSLYEIHQTFVGFGHWFEQSERHFRLGFAYPTQTELIEGLRSFEACLKENTTLKG
jgi:aspartate/methionine/tyrosine aminotransferase